jgi:hypothetical protein
MVMTTALISQSVISEVRWRDFNGKWIDGGNVEGNEWITGGWDVTSDK